MEAIPSSSPHKEAEILSSGSKRGGWITFPFITGAVASLTLAGGGAMGNLIVYLIREFNIKSISAAQISNIVNGSTNLFPVVGAIIADSFFGSFTVASLSSCASLLGTILLALTATLNSLRPQPCKDGSLLCKPPSHIQYAVLYLSVALVAVGIGGTRFTMATMGANQFEKAEHQGVFFNWFFFALYTASVAANTVLVYVEDGVSWGLGFGLCAVANSIGLAILLLGYRFYRPDASQGTSPFVDLARVFVAAFRKWKSRVSPSAEDYYGGNHHGGAPPTPGNRLRFFNRAALISDGDVGSDGSIAKRWSLCTVQQVEDFKTLVGILPLWSSGIFLSTPIAVQTSLAVLQVLTTDRNLGPHFQIPAGSIIVVLLVSTSISLTLVDRVLCPAWQKLIGKPPTSLQRIGVGHVLNVLGMAVSALVESKRLKISYGQSEVMSALWLFPQLALVGIGEAFHLGQVALYYQQFPESLKSTSTAMMSLIIGIAFYLGTALIDLIQRVTGWLPDDINYGRVDNVYWMLVVLGAINFGYYLVCSSLYKNNLKV